MLKQVWLVVLVAQYVCLIFISKLRSTVCLTILGMNVSNRQILIHVDEPSEAREVDDFSLAKLFLLGQRKVKLERA